VKAVYGEMSVPDLRLSFEITAAVRADDYSGFGTTVNPKFTAKFRPVDWLMFRGSYNTGFRVPTFNQIFNGHGLAQPGNGGPTRRPAPWAGQVNVTPGCAAITPDSLRRQSRARAGNLQAVQRRRRVPARRASAFGRLLEHRGRRHDRRADHRRSCSPT
jgi:hypothetical protein